MKLSNLFAKLTGAKTKTLGVLAATTVAAAMLFTAAPKAEAQHFGVGISIGGPGYYAPPPPPRRVYGYGYGYGYGYRPYYGYGYGYRPYVGYGHGFYGRPYYRGYGRRW